jgi:hypothetical protein
MLMAILAASSTVIAYDDEGESCEHNCDYQGKSVEHILGRLLSNVRAYRLYSSRLTLKNDLRKRKLGLRKLGYLPLIGSTVETGY